MVALDHELVKLSRKGLVRVDQLALESSRRSSSSVLPDLERVPSRMQGETGAGDDYGGDKAWGNWARGLPKLRKTDPVKTRLVRHRHRFRVTFSEWKEAVVSGRMPVQVRKSVGGITWS